MATLAVGLGIDVLSTGMGLLAAHKARLTAATNENGAAGQAVKAYDTAVNAVLDAVNAGKVSPDIAAQYMEQEDQRIEQYLQSQVGKPGTSWSGSGKCDKTCTVGCCIYLNDIGPSTQNIIAALRQVSQSGGQASAEVRRVYPSKYGLANRDAYTITFAPPHLADSLTASVSGTISSALASLGIGHSSAPGLTGTVAPGGISAKVLLYGGIFLAGILLILLVER